MKQTYGFSWRDYVRGVTSTFDIGENLAFRDGIERELGVIDAKWSAKIDPAYTLDPKKVAAGKAMPNVIVVAADANGNIVRYYESGETSPYFGSISARSPVNGVYDSTAENRMIASTGKMIAAIAIANEGRDGANSLYLDTEAPARGLETCEKGGTERHGRKAVVAFACSLNGPLVNRTALVGQDRIRKIIDGFGFAMPPAAVNSSGTPPSTAVVLGQISGSPRRVHHMSATILSALIGRGTKPVKAPSLISAYDYTFKGDAQVGVAQRLEPPLLPSLLIRRGATPLLKTLLEGPLCYQTSGISYGTLKSLSHWCASRRPDLKLHFAKTGTQVAVDPNATVDAWISGGLQFNNGAAYSYVVVVGTGSTSQPWATSLHAAQVAAPLLEVLLGDLTGHSKTNPRTDLLPPRPAVAHIPRAHVPQAQAPVSPVPLSRGPAKTTSVRGTPPAIRPIAAADETWKNLSQR